MVMHGPQIWRWMVDSITRCQNRAWVASAYVKAKRIKELCNHLPEHKIEKILVVRWQLNDLVSGASDLEGYDVAKDNGWRIFINLDLHAKTYLFDDVCAVGSANLTDKGMVGVSPPGNQEMLARTTDIVSVSDWFVLLRRTSRELDDNLYKRIECVVREQLDAEGSSDKGKIRYDELLIKELLPKKELRLFTCDMFWSRKLGQVTGEAADERISGDVEHDLSLLGIGSTKDVRVISDRFIASKAFCWLLNMVENQTYFGELTKALQASLCDDPKPYRKDVKLLLNNLLAWTALYGGDFFYIDRPNVSQRITRI